MANFKRNEPRKKAKVSNDWKLSALLRRLARQPQSHADTSSLPEPIYGPEDDPLAPDDPEAWVDWDDGDNDYPWMPDEDGTE